MDGEHRVSVLVAEDHPVFMEGVEAVISSVPGMNVVAQARDGFEAARLILELEPTVAIVDLGMPVLNGIEVVRRVKAAGSSTHLLLLSVHEDRLYVQQAIAAGASGYILKRSGREILLNALSAASTGGLFVDPCIAAQFLTIRTSTAVRRLTARENAVLRLVACGLTSKEIGDKLQISPKSVEAHKSRGTEKLGITSRAMLIKFALLEGWFVEHGCFADGMPGPRLQGVHGK